MEYPEKLNDVVTAANRAAMECRSPIRFSESDFTLEEVLEYWELVDAAKEVRSAVR